MAAAITQAYTLLAEDMDATISLSYSLLAELLPSPIVALCVSRGVLRALAPRLCGALQLSAAAYRMLWRVAPQTMNFARSVTVAPDREESAPPLPLPFNLQRMALHAKLQPRIGFDWTTSNPSTSSTVTCRSLMQCWRPRRCAAPP